MTLAGRTGEQTLAFSLSDGCFEILFYVKMESVLGFVSDAKCQILFVWGHLGIGYKRQCAQSLLSSGLVEISLHSLLEFGTEKRQIFEVCWGVVW